MVEQAENKINLRIKIHAECVTKSGEVVATDTPFERLLEEACIKSETIVRMLLLELIEARLTYDPKPAEKGVADA